MSLLVEANKCMFVHICTTIGDPIIQWRDVERRAWRYQRDNQNPYIEGEQTIQWPKENGQKDKQQLNFLQIEYQIYSICVYFSEYIKQLTKEL